MNIKGFLDKMNALYYETKLKKVYESFCLVDRDERKARLNTVMALSVELHKIKEVNRFGTALGEAPIEAIIEGDWEYAATYIEHFTYKDEGEALAAEIAPLWEPYRVILQTAVAEARRRRTSPTSVHRRGGN